MLTTGKRSLITSLILVCTFALVGCSDGSDTQACFRPTEPGIQVIRVAQNGVSRPFEVYVPATYTGHNAPLVFLLHGSTSSGDAMLRTVNPAGEKIFQVDADKHGYLIAAPSGAVEFGPGFAWNIPGVPLVGSLNYPPDDALDDVAYVALAIDAVSQHLCVDQKRVYATGFSGGGRMSSQLACDLSDRIAAIAPIGGVRSPRASDTPPRTVECAPKRAVPVLALHGTADPVNKYANDDPNIVPGSSWTYGVPEAMDRWALLNSCLLTDARVEDVAPQLTQVKYQSCNADVWLYRFEGLGHVIPGTSGGTEQAAPRLIWEFLGRQSLE